MLLTAANPNSVSDTPGHTAPLRWDTTLFGFFGKAGFLARSTVDTSLNAFALLQARLSETSKGFQLDMMVLNEDFERDVLHQALKDLVSQLQVGERINNPAMTKFL